MSIEGKSCGACVLLPSSETTGKSDDLPPNENERNATNIIKNVFYQRENVVLSSEENGFLYYKYDDKVLFAEDGAGNWFKLNEGGEFEEFDWLTQVAHDAFSEVNASSKECAQDTDVMDIDDDQAQDQTILNDHTSAERNQIVDIGASDEQNMGHIGLITFDENGYPMFPLNAEGLPVLPTAPNGEKVFPTDENGYPIFPVDQNGIKCLPLNDENRPIFPTGPDGRPMIPVDDNGQPLFPRGDSGEFLFPENSDGTPIPPLTIYGHPVVPYDEFGNPFVPLSAEGEQLILFDGYGVPMAASEFHTMYAESEQWQNRQPLLSNQYQEYPGQPQYGYDAFGNMVPLPPPPPQIDPDMERLEIEHRRIAEERQKLDEIEQKELEKTEKERKEREEKEEKIREELKKKEMQEKNKKKLASQLKFMKKQDKPEELEEKRVRDKLSSHDVKVGIRESEKTVERKQSKDSQSRRGNEARSSKQRRYDSSQRINASQERKSVKEIRDKRRSPSQPRDSDILEAKLNDNGESAKKRKRASRSSSRERSRANRSESESNRRNEKEKKRKKSRSMSRERDEEHYKKDKKKADKHKKVHSRSRSRTPDDAKGSSHKRPRSESYDSMKGRDRMKSKNLFVDDDIHLKSKSGSTNQKNTCDDSDITELSKLDVNVKQQESMGRDDKIQISTEFSPQESPIVTKPEIQGTPKLEEKTHITKQSKISAENPIAVSKTSYSPDVTCEDDDLTSLRGIAMAEKLLADLRKERKKMHKERRKCQKVLSELRAARGLHVYDVQSDSDSEREVDKNDKRVLVVETKVRRHNHNRLDIDENGEPTRKSLSSTSDPQLIEELQKRVSADSDEAPSMLNQMRELLSRNSTEKGRKIHINPDRLKKV